MEAQQVPGECRVDAGERQPDDFKGMTARFWALIQEEKLQTHFSGNLDALTAEFLSAIKHLDLNHPCK